jgi:hypothetical protein
MLETEAWESFPQAAFSQARFGGIWQPAIRGVRRRNAIRLPGNPRAVAIILPNRHARKKQFYSSPRSTISTKRSPSASTIAGGACCSGPSSTRSASPWTVDQARYSASLRFFLLSKPDSCMRSSASERYLFTYAGFVRPRANGLLAAICMLSPD